MRSPVVLVSALVALMLMVLTPVVAEARRGCPPGSVRHGNRCVRCPSGFTFSRGRCVKYKVKYKCRPGCTYIGGGKCRCYRRH